jgi:hypothetical protein
MPGPKLYYLYVIGKCAYNHPQIALSIAFYLPFAWLGPTCNKHPTYRVPQY